MEISDFNRKIFILINKLCFQVHFKFLTSIEVWLGNYLKFANLPSNVYFLLTMIAFSCALYNIITGRHFVKYWVPVRR
jgi:hypothetical protein